MKAKIAFFILLGLTCRLASAVGENSVWFMDGASRTSSGRLADVSNLSWQVVGVGDFNGDTFADILWRNQTNGQNSVWLMSGATRIGGGSLATVANLDWQVAGVGDFNNDGRADILWRNQTSGRNSVWFMSGISRIGGGPLITVANQDWQIVGMADFDGNNFADILWRNRTNGRNALWFWTGAVGIGTGVLNTVGNPLDTVASSAWQVVGVGDFNGDTFADILWRNRTSGQNSVWLMSGTSRIGGGPLITVSNTAWLVSGVGDFDNDGNADILWRNAPDLPNITGLYTGSGSITLSGCADPGDNGTFGFSATVSIPAQSGDQFSASARLTTTVQGVEVIDLCELSGTVAADGSMSGAVSCDLFIDGFFDSSSEGTFVARLQGDTLNISSSSRDVIGDICRSSAGMTVTR